MRGAVKRLPYKNQELIYMRFWDLLTIEEIAQKICMSWADADRLIEKSLIMLKKIFLSDLNRANNVRIFPRRRVVEVKNGENLTYGGKQHERFKNEKQK